MSQRLLEARRAAGVKDVLVHEPDPKISDIGTTCGGKIQQCFSERQIPIDNEIT